MTDIMHISSLIVMALPERLAEIVNEIEKRGGEVAASDPSGKLVVVLETSDESDVTAFANELSLMSGTLSANLVFHHIDEETPQATNPPLAPSAGETR